MSCARLSRVSRSTRTCAAFLSRSVLSWRARTASSPLPPGFGMRAPKSSSSRMRRAVAATCAQRPGRAPRKERARGEREQKRHGAHPGKVRPQRRKEHRPAVGAARDLDQAPVREHAGGDGEVARRVPRDPDGVDLLGAPAAPAVGHEPALDLGLDPVRRDGREERDAVGRQQAHKERARVGRRVRGQPGPQRDRARPARRPGRSSPRAARPPRGRAPRASARGPSRGSRRARRPRRRRPGCRSRRAGSRGTGGTPQAWGRNT